MEEYFQDTKVGPIGYELKAINHIIQRKMIENADNAGIDEVTLMHGWIICYLFENQHRDIFQKDIECKFSIARSTVTNILKLMEKKGYIKRQSVDSDARLKKLTLTEKGIELEGDIKRLVDENEKSFNSILSDEERATFIRLVHKLKSGLQNN